MAAKPIDESIIQDIIADWRTGEFSQRDLAKRYSVSAGKVAAITKGIAKDAKSIVSAGIQYKQGLALHDERMVSAINGIVDKKIEQAEWLNKTAMKIAEISLKALELDPSVQNASLAQKTMIDTQKAAGIVPYYPTQATITNTNAQQNVHPQIMTRVIDNGR